MRTQSIERMAAGWLMIGLALAVTGCASSGYQKEHRVGSSLQTSAGRIERQLVRLDAAVSTLNDLVNNPQPDLRPQFKKFSAALGKPGALAASIREADQDMQKRGTVFFEDWKNELAGIRNEEIRSRGLARQTEVLNQYNAVRSDSLKALTEINPLESDLWDVHQFLNADLTPGGLAAIRNAAGRVNQRASPVHESVGKLAGDMRALGVAMSPLNVTK